MHVTCYDFFYCIHSFVRTFVRTFVCSFVRSYVRSFVRSFARSLVRSFDRLTMNNWKTRFINRHRNEATLSLDMSNNDRSNDNYMCI